MSSNNPYGGPQPPMARPGAPGSASRAAAVTVRVSAAARGPAGRPPALATPSDPSPPTSRPPNGKAVLSLARTDHLLARTAPGPAQPAPQPKGKGKILIIIGAAALAVILMAVFAVVVATRGGPAANPGGNTGTQGQQTNPSQSSAPQSTPRPSDAVTAYLQALAAGDAVAALSYAADPAPTGRSADQ